MRPAVVLLWAADPDGAWLWSSECWSVFTGQSCARSLGRGWLDAVHPDDRPGLLNCWRAAARAGGLSVDARIHDASRGHYDRLRLTAAPRRDAEGLILEWAGVATPSPSAPDPGDAKTGEELQRQMRNNLAVIRSVARRTARTSDSLEHHVTHFEGRLDALARVQSALMRAYNHGVDLEALVAEELVAHRIDERHLRIDGPPVRLQAFVAERLGLALHELVANAVKFGAFGQGGGSVAIRWSVIQGTDASRLLFHWREAGVALISPAPRRQGFGSELIEKSLPYELNAETELTFAPGGVQCTIDIPLGDLGPSRAT